MMPRRVRGSRADQKLKRVRNGLVVTKMSMNEATLEGNLNSTLDRLFRGPLRLRIRHQTVLTIRFGHHEITVDGSLRSEARGRLDVLLSDGDIPLALLELKRPGLRLTDEDESQARSYARLLNPMPPIYIVTNGEETRFFNTYSGERLNLNTVDEHAVAEQIAAAAGAAAADHNSAIRFLLGRSPEVFKQLFGTVTNAELSLVTGADTDLLCPIAEDFQVPRVATALLRRCIGEKHPVIVLTGPPLSGKTNVASELCRPIYGISEAVSTIIPLYLNCLERAQGVFQSLASEFTKQTSLPTTSDDVRQWLTSGCMTAEGDRPAIILDALPSELGDRWQSEIAELVSIAGNTTFTIVLILDESHADFLLNHAHRGQPSRLGTIAKRIQVRPYFSHQELIAAQHVLSERNDLLIEDGSEHNILYRLPYTWRLLASALNGPGIVSSVFPVTYVHSARKILDPSPQHWDAIRCFAEAITNEPLRDPIREFLLASPGWLTVETARRFIALEGLQLLQGAGFIRARHGPHDHAFFSMQLPPLLASAAAFVIMNRLKAAAATNLSPTEATDQLLADCARFPYGTPVAANALLMIEPESIAQTVIDELLSRDPTVSRLSPGARFGLVVEGRHLIDVPAEVIQQSIEEGTDQVFGDFIPFLIVSYVASAVDLSSSHGQQWFKAIIDRVGRSRVPLLPIDVKPIAQMRSSRPILMYDLIGGGSLVSSSNGIIEPITDAIRQCALKAPSLFDEYVSGLLAQSESSLPLLYRVWTAASSVAEMDNPVAAAAARLAESLQHQIQELLPTAIRPSTA